MGGSSRLVGKNEDESLLLLCNVQSQIQDLVSMCSLSLRNWANIH